MNDQAWLQRLDEQLPGWLVWRTGGSLVGGVRWNAAPAPEGTPRTEYPRLQNVITAGTPAELRTLARERYGWNDHCESCGVLARECGHRQPDREGALRRVEPRLESAQDPQRCPTCGGELDWTDDRTGTCIDPECGDET